jgi:hypothetical protein
MRIGLPGQFCATAGRGATLSKLANKIKPSAILCIIVPLRGIGGHDN